MDEREAAIAGRHRRPDTGEFPMVAPLTQTHQASLPTQRTQPPATWTTPTVEAPTAPWLEPGTDPPVDPLGAPVSTHRPVRPWSRRSIRVSRTRAAGSAARPARR